MCGCIGRDILHVIFGVAQLPFPYDFLGWWKNLWFWMRISAVLDLLSSPCSEMLELVQITILEEDVSIQLGRCSHLSWVIFFYQYSQKNFFSWNDQFYGLKSMHIAFFRWSNMFSNMENYGILIPLKIKAKTSRFWLKKKIFRELEDMIYYICRICHLLIL